MEACEDVFGLHTKSFMRQKSNSVSVVTMLRNDWVIIFELTVNIY